MIAKPCQTCRGAGRVGRERKLTVKIPAGIATGQRLRLHGEGEHGTAGGPAGDLYVVVHVQEHAFFQREDDDLYCELPIALPDARARRRSVKVPTLDGREELQHPRRHAAGRALQAARQGHAERLRPRPRRPARDRARGGAEEAHQGTAAAARGARADAAARRADGDGSESAEKPFFERVKDIFG